MWQYTHGDFSREMKPRGREDGDHTSAWPEFNLFSNQGKLIGESNDTNLNGCSVPTIGFRRMCILYFHHIAVALYKLSPETHHIAAHYRKVASSMLQA